MATERLKLRALIRSALSTPQQSPALAHSSSGSEMPELDVVHRSAPSHQYKERLEEIADAIESGETLGRDSEDLRNLSKRLLSGEDGRQKLQTLRNFAARRRNQLEAYRHLSRTDPDYEGKAGEARAFGLVAKYAGELLSGRPPLLSEGVGEDGEDPHTWVPIDDADPDQTECCSRCGAQRNRHGPLLARAVVTGGWPEIIDCEQRAARWPAGRPSPEHLAEMRANASNHQPSEQGGSDEVRSDVRSGSSEGRNDQDHRPRGADHPPAGGEAGADHGGEHRREAGELADPTQQPAQEGDEAALDRGLDAFCDDYNRKQDEKRRAPASARSAFFDVLTERSLDEALDAAFAAAPRLELSGDPHKAAQPSEDQEGEDDWPPAIAVELREVGGKLYVTTHPERSRAVGFHVRRYLLAPGGEKR